VALTGNTANFTAGSVTPSISIAVTGNTANFTTGTIAPALSLALTGGVANFTAGTVTPSITVALTGNTGSFTAGNVSAPSGDITVALTGNSATFSAGSVAIGGGVVNAGRRSILIDVRGNIHEFATEQGANAFLKSLEPIEERQIQAKAKRIVSAVTRTGNAFLPPQLTPVKVISGPPELTALANMRAAILQGQLNALVNAQIQAEMQQFQDDELAAVAVMMMMEEYG
jgi:hypothetical protein